MIYNRIPAIAIVVTTLLAGCSGSGGGSSSDTKATTHKATVTGINVVRTTDKQPISVSSLPVDSATVTVQ